MTKTIMAFGLFLSIGLPPAIGQCLCPEGRGGLVFSHEFGGGQKLIVCGYENGDGESYSDIVVIDCRDERVLLSIEPGETDLSLNMFRFQVKEGGVFIEQITRLPGEPGWRWAPYPFIEKKVSLVDGRLKLSDWQNIFIVPPKTQGEIAAFLDAYENHFDMAGDPMEIPDKLMLCALNGCRKAERFLLEFPKDHSNLFDGALAEGYSELLDFYRKVKKK